MIWAHINRGRGIIRIMGSNDQQVVAKETDDLPAVADPEDLVNGIRRLQEMIPGFTQLSISEERSMASVAYLDPEVLATGIHAAGAWEAMKQTTGMSAEELRAETEALDRWEDVKRELMAFVKGIDGAILSRRHRVGTAILQLYAILGTLIRDPKNEHLRPYYENMKKAQKQRRKKGSGKKKTGAD